MNVVRLKAHAKVNLFLEILGRRADGYHTLSTVFQEVGLADELAVSARPAADGVTLRCAGADLPTGSGNLATRAAEAFRARFPASPGYAVRLTKRIPVGAGLGGGSSDAAATLKACWRLGSGRPRAAFPWRRFVPLAAGLGADVPFFLRGGLAEAGGIGDRLRPLAVSGREKGAKTHSFVLIFPRVFLSTRWVYGRLRFPLTNRRSKHRLTKYLTEGAPAKEWAPLLFNRLEDVVLPRVPAVAAAKRALTRAGCLGALMSGSGSAVFGVVDTAARARAVRERVRSSRWDVWVARPVPGTS